MQTIGKSKQFTKPIFKEIRVGYWIINYSLVLNCAEICLKKNVVLFVSEKNLIEIYHKMKKLKNRK